MHSFCSHFADRFALALSAGISMCFPASSTTKAKTTTKTV